VHPEGQGVQSCDEELMYVPDGQVERQLLAIKKKPGLHEVHRREEEQVKQLLIH
jgi:hypothetical protein